MVFLGMKISVGNSVAICSIAYSDSQENGKLSQSFEGTFLKDLRTAQNITFQNLFGGIVYWVSFRKSAHLCHSLGVILKPLGIPSHYIQSDDNVAMQSSWMLWLLLSGRCWLISAGVTTDPRGHRCFLTAEFSEFEEAEWAHIIALCRQETIRAKSFFWLPKVSWVSNLIFARHVARDKIEKWERFLSQDMWIISSTRAVEGLGQINRRFEFIFKACPSPCLDLDDQVIHINS